MDSVYVYDYISCDSHDQNYINAEVHEAIVSCACFYKRSGDTILVMVYVRPLQFVFKSTFFRASSWFGLVRLH